MKTIHDLFNDIWRKKWEKNWEYVYIMVDLHGVIIPSTYHSSDKFEFVNESAKDCLQYLSRQNDVRLILWTSSHKSEISNVLNWLRKHGIEFNSVNSNPFEKNTEYANFSEKPYFSILLDDKAGFEKSDWDSIVSWIVGKELSKFD